MNWHRGRLAAFDLETTGPNPEHDRIVTAAVSLLGGGQPAQHHAWLVDPGVEIPAEAIAVHGITNERVRAEGEDAAEAIGEIVQLLAEQVAAEVPIVAFNARFDLTVLDRDARRNGVLPLLERIGGVDRLLAIDPYVLDKQFDRFRKGRRTLHAVCEHYRIPFDEAHVANADALAAARVAYRLASRTEELSALDLATLHREQVGWAATQAASLEEHFVRQGRAERVERAWPLVPAQLPLAA
ncbi:MAG: exonuclease domain-containing protein [Solirubrobacteraceae bacterium]